SSTRTPAPWVRPDWTDSTVSLRMFSALLYLSSQKISAKSPPFASAAASTRSAVFLSSIPCPPSSFPAAPAARNQQLPQPLHNSPQRRRHIGKPCGVEYLSGRTVFLVRQISAALQRRNGAVGRIEHHRQGHQVKGDHRRKN